MRISAPRRNGALRPGSAIHTDWPPPDRHELAFRTRVPPP